MTTQQWPDAEPEGETPRTDAVQAELRAEWPDQIPAEEKIFYYMEAAEAYGQACADLERENADLRRELGPWRLIERGLNDDTWRCIECKSTVSKGRGHYPSPYGHTRECSHGVGPTITQVEEAERQLAAARAWRTVADQAITSIGSFDKGLQEHYCELARKMDALNEGGKP